MPTGSPPALPARPIPPWALPLALLGRGVLRACEVMGGMTLLQVRILRALIPPTFDRDETIRQAYKIGVQSVAVVTLTALFVGGLMLVQTGPFVRRTGATGMVGWGTGLATLAEVGPVLIGLMFGGRVGSNNAAELGTMVITEQVEALRLLGIDPIRYLVVPRFLSMIVMLVLLTCIGDLAALVGASVACQAILGIEVRVFWQGLIDGHLLDEFLMGLVKGFFFGGAIGIVSCHYGLRVTGGATGVGRAVNETVVTSAIAIFVVNFLVTSLWV
ncbi:MAG TPA: ABC transporter permease [Myxococcota bacterium]|nr:ABC transporter permease [Myxococcota bacterium]HQK50795.1 ABC transporter permease [Myxococcota bacterium]